MHITETPEQPPDFFISRAGSDAAFAAEIGRILEDDGKTVVLQQWDFANRNFMERMHSALESGARVIALLSNDYLASDHCSAEWLNAIARDPLNKQGRLIVLRVAESTPTGLLTALAYWDLVPVRGDRNLVHDIVLAAVRPGRHKDLGAIGQYWQAPRPVLHPEIRPTSSFTGRDAELASIHEMLWSRETAAITQPVAAHALGGIGKSALAREYAYRHSADFAGVWWLNALTPADGGPGFDGIERALVELGAIFIRGLDEAKDRAAAARQTLDFIAHGGFEKPWLLVYDNVDDARTLREWPPIGNAHILMTTRISGWPAGIGTVEIEEWPLPEAIEYLQKESNRSGLTEAEARELAQALGCLPLALSHTAALLRARPNVTPAIYIEGSTRRMNEAPKGAEYPRAVFATFREALAEAEREARGASAVMSLAAFFAPDNIPEQLFRQPPDRYPPALADLVAKPDAIDDAIGALANLSLVDFHPESRTLSVHGFVLAAARDALGDSAATWLSGALRTVASAFPDPEDSRNWPACERLVSHVRSVASHVTQDSPGVAWLLGTTGVYLEERAALAEVLPFHKRAGEIFKQLATADPGNARWQYDLSVSQEKIGDVQRAQGNLAQALESYQASLTIRERLAAIDPGNVLWHRGLSAAHSKMGDMLSAKGNLAVALDSYRASLTIAERLAAADPQDACRQRDLSVAQEKMGEVQRAQGSLAVALDSYRTSLAIRQRLATADPSNARWQREFSVSQEKIGDVQSAQGDLAQALDSYRASLAIRERLAAADPSNAGWQRDLSVAHDRMGSVQRAQGDLGAALDSYCAFAAVAERLAAADPSHTGWQRDLSVAQEKIGDVLLNKGDLDGAEGSCRASLAIRERLSAADPSNAQWQRDLSVAHSRIGDVRSAKVDFGAALKSYRASLAISERLAAADPSNASWQRELSVSHNKIGDVQRAQGYLGAALNSYRAALAIIERLAATDPSHTGWQRDLSVSQEKIGDVQSAQGNLAQALDSYRASLAIRERLAAADPGNAGWQRDLSVPHNKIGDVQSAQGNLAQALESYRASLAIAERLAAADPGNAGWQRDLSVSHNKIGDVQSAQGNLAQALESYRASLAIRERLAAADPGNAGWQRDLSVSHGRLALIDALQGESERALAGFREGRTIIARLREASPDHALLASDLAWFDAEIAKLSG